MCEAGGQQRAVAKEGSTERVCGGGGRKAGVAQPNLPAGGKNERRWGGGGLNTTVRLDWI